MQVPYEATVKVMLASLERNLLPDAVIRRLTRMLLAGRLRSCYKTSSELQLADLLQFVHSLKEMPIAIKTDKPKTQHYELPTSFFKLVLGKNLKYSAAVVIFLINRTPWKMLRKQCWSCTAKGHS